MNISLWTTVLALALILTLASEIQLVSEQTLFNTRSDKAANLVRMHIENNHNRLLLITNISATDWNDKDSSFYLLKPFIRK